MGQKLPQTHYSQILHGKQGSQSLLAHHWSYSINTNRVNLIYERFQFSFKPRHACLLAYPPTPWKRRGKGESFLREHIRREPMLSPETSPATMKTLSSPSTAAFSITDFFLALNEANLRVKRGKQSLIFETRNILLSRNYQQDFDLFLWFKNCGNLGRTNHLFFFFEHLVS